MVDIISSLPDDILCHILSFLPTKLAFTTTLLSKRWLPLFYSLPVLDINNDPFKDHDTFHRFCHFLDNIMLSPLSTNKPLKKFILECHYYRDQESHICLWLEAAKRRRVEEFHLSLPLHVNPVKPNIFITQTLVVLKLDTVEIESDTSCVHLPSLKTLHLNFVFFENQKDCINFLSACPNLQDLHVSVICNDHYENNALGKWSMDFMFDVIKNVQFLSIVCYPANQQGSFKIIPVFQNLIHIELRLCDCLFLCWDDVVELLRHCPKLQILFITKWKETNSSKEWKHPISILECVRFHLRSCTIFNFDGWANDVQFATYILQNASHLQDMKIGGNTIRLLFEQSQIIEELSLCPKISPTCKLSFEF